MPGPLPHELARMAWESPASEDGVNGLRQSRPDSTAPERVDVPGIEPPHEAFIEIGRTPDGLYRAVWRFTFNGAERSGALPLPYLLKAVAKIEAAQLMLAAARKIGWRKAAEKFCNAIKALVESLKNPPTPTPTAPAPVPEENPPTAIAVAVPSTPDPAPKSAASSDLGFAPDRSLLDNQYITLADAGNLFPVKVKAQRVYSWCVSGVKVMRSRVYLEHARNGNRVVTTQKWIEQFQEALRRASIKPPPTQPQVPIPRQRGPAAILRAMKQDHRDAVAELMTR